jgi:hypothetical protein
MLHGLDLASADPTGRLGGEAEPVGQPERRSSRGPAAHPAALRLRPHSAGPERPDGEVGDSQSPADPIRSHPPLQAIPAALRKHRDFELFADICERMARGEHLLRSGLLEIVRLAGEMNPSGKRGYSTDLVVQNLTKMKA